MSEQQNLTEEKQFLQEIGQECDFYGDTLAVFLERFERSKKSLSNEILSQYIEWGKKPVNGGQKILDELRKNIYPVLKEKGCPILDKQAGKKTKGCNPSEIVLKWLWGTKFSEWKNQKNQENVSNNINWYQICQSRLDAYKEYFLNNPLTTGNYPNIYVPLGLVEPKREQEKRQKQEVNPEEGSRFYQLAETEITKTYSEPNQFFEEVLQKGNSKSKGQKIAIIGEPGAGKTTLLYQIAQWILDQELGYPILIRLADVDKPIEEYLTKNWLRYATKSTGEVSPEWVSAFEQLMRGDKVWLLLDAVDEMGIMSPLADINKQLANELHGLRVVLTCRLNVWEGEKNALSGFDVYRNLDFNSQQIQDFIEQWFNDKTQSQELLKQLNESNQNRINDLIKNPLRLALLCRTWKLSENKGGLPDNQWQLYQGFVQDFYDYKFSTKKQDQVRINQVLGELAKWSLEQNYSRYCLCLDQLPQSLKTQLGYEDDEDSVLSFTIRLGWLNKIGTAAENPRQQLYAFFHPTFQEYFAALAIKDWDYFLPRNHVNCPVEGKEYRIFQPQWKQVILLWLGRDDVEEQEKEAFIRKLVSFETGCYGNFYRYRAYFLAAAGINEFKECSLSDEIVEQIVKWGFGYFNIKKQKWITFLDPIKEGARIVLPETIREKAIAHLIRVLETTDDQETSWKIANILGEIAVGNELVIRKLTQSLETTNCEEESWRILHILGKIAFMNEWAIEVLTRVIKKSNKSEFGFWHFSESLEKINPGNKFAIPALIMALEEYPITPWNFTDALGRIAVENELAIRGLLKILKTTEDEDIKFYVIDGLGKIALGNKLAIEDLIQSFVNTEDEQTRWKLADSLCKIKPGDKFAIQELIQMLETTEDEDIRRVVADSLVKIGFNNEFIIQSLIEILENAKNEDVFIKISYILSQIAIGNKLAIQSLIQVIKTTEYENSCWKFAYNLGRINPRDEVAIQALIRALETTENEDIYRMRMIAESLGTIDPGKEVAIQALIRALEITEDEENQRRIAESLGTIDHGKEIAIQALIRLLETTKDIVICRNIAESLGEIAVGNELAILALIRTLETTYDKNTCRDISESLVKIIKTEEQYADVVFALKHNLTNEVYENNFDLFETCYKLLWKCAQNLPYPKFYQAS